MSEIRHLPPLPPAERKKVKRPEKVSQTALSRFDVCPRSAFLYWKYKRRAASRLRWSVAKSSTASSSSALEQLRDNGERDFPSDVAKDQIMALVEERTDVHLPEYEQNALRAMAWNWAEATVVDPEQDRRARADDRARARRLDDARQTGLR